jgi:adenylate kinase
VISRSNKFVARLDDIMNSFRMVITGNPGVGKHTTAAELKKNLKDVELIDINDLALEHQAFFQGRGSSFDEVDTRKLASIIRSKIRESRRSIIVGHLAPYVLMSKWVDLVVVLRRSPYAILNTLEKRNYIAEKVRENAASEILGIILYDSIERFGLDKIAEYDTTETTPFQISREIISLLRGETDRKVGVIDWLTLISKRGDVERFLEYS